MRKDCTLYDVSQQRFYSLLMLCLLLWLTISTPVIYDAQQDAAAAQGITCTDDSNPLSGTNEEKAESGVNTLSEYLHETTHYQPTFTQQQQAYKCHPDEVYAAFHPELIAPPPEALL